MGDLSGEVLDRLEREEVAWCATVRPDGSAHLTPVWFVFDAGTWWLSCAARSVKARNLARDPRVSLALEGGRSPVVAEGSAVTYHDRFPAHVVAGFAGKYGGWDITANDAEGARVLLEVPVTRWLLAGVAQ